MANSNRKRILDNIASTLAAVTTGGGYNFTIGEAKRGLKAFDSVPADKFPVCYVAGADEVRTNVTNTQFRSDLRVSVVGYVKAANAADDEALEQRLDNLIEDITKALMVDITRGGYATLTEIVEVDTDKGAWQPFAGVEMVVRCQYRASVSAP
ncbi:MAG TPA: hypothetical protein VEA41_02535 [Salinarimonas sp.]|nr:hypothetical protein [Salinarimonas sp.]